MPGPLEGKTALVTGSSRGIGKAIALQLAADGANVVVCARTEQTTGTLPGSLDETITAIRIAGGHVLGQRVDVTNDDDLHAVVDATLKEFGRIDILVNNAGGGTSTTPFVDLDPAALDASYRLNVRAPFILAQLAARQMVQAGGGVIVNISSGAARNRPPPGQGLLAGQQAGAAVPYGMSKAALDRFGTGIAHELAAQNVAVISVNPGRTLTERSAMRQEPGADLSGYERPETTAKAVTYLCQHAMEYTGHVLTSRAFVDEKGL